METFYFIAFLSFLVCIKPGFQQATDAIPDTAAGTLGDFASLDITGGAEGAGFVDPASNVGGNSEGVFVDATGGVANPVDSPPTNSGGVETLLNFNANLDASLGTTGDFGGASIAGGNVASGLSNSPSSGSGGADALGSTLQDHIITDTLRNNVIVANLFDEGFQSISMPAQTPQSQTDQVNQINRMINSPQLVHNAFPNQKVVDGGVVVVASSGTALDASFTDRTKSSDLPSFTPARSPQRDTAQDFTSNFRLMGPDCTGERVPHLINNKLYWVIQPGHPPHEMQCPLGTLFNRAKCDCSTIAPKYKDCRPDLIVLFDYGIKDTSGHLLAHSEDSNLTPNRGILCFDGTQKLAWPRYNGYDFMDKLYITLRFKTDIRNRDQLFPLMTNCEVDSLTGAFFDPSLGIVLNRTDHVVIFLQTSNGMSLTSFKVDPTQWNTVVIQYDGSHFTASVNDQSDRIATEGNIQSRKAPLVFGYCQRYGYFEGCLDDAFVYPCIPSKPRRP